MKKGMNHYATKNRFKQKGYFYKYSDGGSGRKAREASRCNSLQQSRKEQKEEIETQIQLYGKVVLLTEEVIYTGEENESVREKDVGKTHQEGRQRIQGTDQGRCETEETNTCQTKGKKMKKQSAKEKKHEARETKAYEKKEDKLEAKKEAKGKKK